MFSQSCLELPQSRRGKKAANAMAANNSPATQLASKRKAPELAQLSGWQVWIDPKILPNRRRWQTGITAGDSRSGEKNGKPYVKKKVTPLQEPTS